MTPYAVSPVSRCFYRCVVRAACRYAALVALFALAGCADPRRSGNGPADAVARNADVPCSMRLHGGWIVDGSGASGRRGDVLLAGERLLAVGTSGNWGEVGNSGDWEPVCEQTLDVSGLVVAPGFINMLSWASESLLLDPRALSDVKQGVTLEVMGEGRSMGPFSSAQVASVVARQGDHRFEVSWQTLGGYFDLLADNGIGVNVASFVGATTIREHVVGGANRAPSVGELSEMQALVAAAMREGALGVGSSLIYAPASFAATDELIALTATAAEFGGGYISHLRSEGGALLAGVAELIEIAEATGARAGIYHLKAAGSANWHKLDAAIELIEDAQARGVRVNANIYPYTAGATGLDAVMPPWVQAGGVEDWIARLRDPDIRARVIRQMRDPNPDWENFLLDGPDKALLLGFRNHALRGYIGMTLAEVANQRGVSAEDAAIDLVIADGSQVDVAFTLMSEANVRKKLRLPWVSIGSDASAPAAEGLFLRQNEHPRAYGSFARVLGKYVREEQVLTLTEAVHRVTGLAASHIGVADRGLLKAGLYADIAVFDPQRVQDRATFEDSHRYASGMQHVFVNGQRVLADGQPTGVLSGQIVRGPGWARAEVDSTP